MAAKVEGRGLLMEAENFPPLASGEDGKGERWKEEGVELACVGKIRREGGTDPLFRWHGLRLRSGRLFLLFCGYER